MLSVMEWGTSVILTCTEWTHWTLEKHKQLGLWIRMKNQGVSVDVYVAVVIPLKNNESTSGQGTYSWHLPNEKKLLCGGYETCELTWLLGKYFVSLISGLPKLGTLWISALAYGKFMPSTHSFVCVGPHSWTFFSHRAHGSLLNIKCHRDPGKLRLVQPRSCKRWGIWMPIPTATAAMQANVAQYQNNLQCFKSNSMEAPDFPISLKRKKKRKGKETKFLT